MNSMIRFVQHQLKQAADPRKALPMAAYMKTDMPFYGVQKPGRERILRELLDRFPIETRKEYIDVITSLWKLPHREEKYLAIQVAITREEFIVVSHLPFYRRLIIEGAWWDFVDDIAIRLVGRLVHEHRSTAGRKMDGWIADPNMWIRRSALICHIKHKSDTNERQLFLHCLQLAREKEFFIRKAIGWTLREYARTKPDRVRRFLASNRDKLSPLSLREAGKHLGIRRRTIPVHGRSKQSGNTNGNSHIMHHTGD